MQTIILHSLLQSINVAMKESSTENSTMLNRNWVLKRKRRKLPAGAVKFGDKSKFYNSLKFPSTTRSKRELKEDDSPDQRSGKRKGNDGVSYLTSPSTTFSLSVLLYFQRTS